MATIRKVCELFIVHKYNGNLLELADLGHVTADRCILVINKNILPVNPIYIDKWGEGRGGINELHVEGGRAATPARPPF